MNNQIQHYQHKLDFEIDAADVADYFTIQPLKKMILIDARSPEGFATEHIPGAINFPHRTMNEETTKILNTDVVYVTYCDGIGCNASTKAALKLSKLGFTVKELMGGLDWWKRDGYSTEGHAGVRRNMNVRCAC